MRQMECAFLAFAILLSSGCSWIKERRFISGIISQPAPDFELAGLDGKKVRLSEYRGRPVLLAFWAYG